MSFISTTRDVPATRRPRAWRRIVLLALAALWAGTAYWQTHKPLPPGLHVESEWYPSDARDVSFIADITSADAYGRPIMSQAIFDEALKVVRSARKFIVLDYNLFGGQRPPSDGSGPPLREISAELREALIEQRRAQPDLQVLFITDPVNGGYGGTLPHDLVLLRAAGVEVVVTNLNLLRDPNFIYSSLWRITLGWWSGNGSADPNARASPEGGSLANPLDQGGPPLTWGAWARLANFKANQRKLVIADDGNGSLVAIVGSANPHDGSSAHSNVALKVSGPVLQSLLLSELSVARFSGWRSDPGSTLGKLAVQTDANATAAIAANIPAPAGAGAAATATAKEIEMAPSATPAPATIRTKVLTEGAIRAALLEHIDAAARGDSIDIAMLHVSDRGIVESLIAASKRGASVRLILDPNREAFGRAKTGIPNQPVASELAAASDGAIHVRWYRTHGEQFHAALTLIHGRERLWLALGSANLTRRNLADYDLEADLAVEMPEDSALAHQALVYFETLWSNRAGLGIEYTADFGLYADPSQWHYWLYRVLEGTGLSAF